MTRTHRLIVWGFIELQMVVSLLLMNRVPAIVPIHWNIHGQVDGYGSRWIALAGIPGVCIVLGVLMIVLPLIGPFGRNMERSTLAYGRINIAVFAFLTVLHVSVLLIAAGVAVPLNRVILVGMGLMFALVGNWLGKVRRNFWIGIRTPWTLKSDVVWERTHRVAAKVFFAGGMIGALVALVVSNWITVLGFIAGMLLISIWSILYSWWLYHHVNELNQPA
jgi:uncharacterized membrane protein